MKSQEIIEYLQGKPFLVSKRTLCRELHITNACASYHLGRLRKQRITGIYKNKYWGLILRDYSSQRDLFGGVSE